jgi:hypothetical protein
VFRKYKPQGFGHRLWLCELNLFWYGGDMKAHSPTPLTVLFMCNVQRCRKVWYEWNCKVRDPETRPRETRDLIGSRVNREFSILTDCISRKYEWVLWSKFNSDYIQSAIPNFVCWWQSLSWRIDTSNWTSPSVCKTRPYSNKTLLRQ